MKIPVGLTQEPTKVDVDRNSETIPTNKAVVLIAVDVRQVIADVL
jgi:hypothetical protein